MSLQGYIFQSTTGQDAPFEAVFPQIEAVEVVINETGPGNEGLGLRCLTRRSVREWINCSNPRCCGKGIALGDLMRQLVRENRNHWDGLLTCQSREESGAPCTNTFHVALTIRFRR